VPLPSPAVAWDEHGRRYLKDVNSPEDAAAGFDFGFASAAAPGSTAPLPIDDGLAPPLDGVEKVRVRRACASVSPSLSLAIPISLSSPTAWLVPRSLLAFIH
jgi:hypothetical protein